MKKTLILLMLTNALASAAPPPGGLPALPAPKAAAAGPRLVLAWDSSPSGYPVDGYRVYWGFAAHTYTNMVNAGTNLQATVTNLVPSATYYFAATAYLGALESAFSVELAHTMAAPATNRIVTIAGQVSGDLAAWAPWSAFTPIVLTNPAGTQYYRLTITETKVKGDAK